jgi:hypothetical protein
MGAASRRVGSEGAQFITDGERFPQLRRRAFAREKPIP